MAVVMWTEKYRPKTVGDYVFRDEQQRAQVNGWIKDKAIPTLLLSGSPGVGKSTLAKMLCNEIDVHPLDFKEINASRMNSIEDVRNTILNFVQMMPMGDFRVVLLDEADGLSPASQGALRGIIEEYHETARFIFTANYPHKIIPAIHSRSQGFHIEKLDQVEYTARVAQILINEEVEFDIDNLDTYVKVAYPDLRKCINLLQQNSQSGVLESLQKGDTSDADYKIKMVELFKDGKISDARKIVCSQARPDEMEEIYKWIYTNLDLISDSEEKQEQAILILKQALVDHTICADPEINLAATFIRLSRI